MIDIPLDYLVATAALRNGSPTKNAREQGAVLHLDFRATDREEPLGQSNDDDANSFVKARDRRERFPASFVA